MNHLEKLQKGLNFRPKFGGKNLLSERPKNQYMRWVTVLNEQTSGFELIKMKPTVTARFKQKSSSFVHHFTIIAACGKKNLARYRQLIWPESFLSCTL